MSDVNTRFADNSNQKICLAESLKISDSRRRERRQRRIINVTMGQRIRDARLKAGLTQEDFAKAIGASQSAVANWETEENKPRRDLMLRIAKVLDTTPEQLEFGSNLKPVDESDLRINEQEPSMAPVYASAEGGNGEASLNKGDIVEYRPKPLRYQSVKGLYAFYVVGDSMSPRIKRGEMIWVNPNREPSIGQEAVFFEKDDGTGESAIMVKEFRGARGSNYVAYQHNPSKEVLLPRGEWSIQLIVDIDLNR